jgi:uncharacterized delta-60 repeat protein
MLMGSLDIGFDPNVDGPVRCLAVQADGKVLLGGAFGTVFSIARQCIARVNPDGTLDSGFDPKANFNVYSVAVQADGKVLLGGLFTTLQPNGAPYPTTRNGIARVNANGTLDTGFDPNSNSSISSIAVQADGKVLLGGFFTTLQPNDALTPTTRNRIARVNADATLDTGFDPNANDGVASVALQADGKIILGGSFTTLQPNGAVMPTERRRVARVNADGTLDSAFDPKANDQVFGVAIQADGRVLLNGNFTTLQPNGAAPPTIRNYFARLYNDPTTQFLTAPSASQITWQRGGAAPEISRVTFEQTVDGGSTWTAVGSATRVGATSNWQRTGLNLPMGAPLTLRATGETIGSQYNGSSGLVQAIGLFSQFPSRPGASPISEPVRTAVLPRITPIPMQTACATSTNMHSQVTPFDPPTVLCRPSCRPHFSSAVTRLPPTSVSALKPQLHLAPVRGLPSLLGRPVRMAGLPNPASAPRRTTRAS